MSTDNQNTSSGEGSDEQLERASERDPGNEEEVDEQQKPMDLEEGGEGLQAAEPDGAAEPGVLEMGEVEPVTGPAKNDEEWDVT